MDRVHVKSVEANGQRSRSSRVEVEVEVEGSKGGNPWEKAKEKGSRADTGIAGVQPKNQRQDSKKHLVQTTLLSNHATLTGLAGAGQG